MYSKMRNLAVFAACFLGFAAVAPAQVSGLEGTIKNPDGSPAVGAVVKIDRQDIKGNYNVKTDKKGHWGHYGLPLGSYIVSLEIDGRKILADRATVIEAEAGVDRQRPPDGDGVADERGRRD